MTDQLRDRIAAALSVAGAFCGGCGFEPGETGCPDCVTVRGMYTDAVLAVVQDELDRLQAELTAALAALRRRRTPIQGSGYTPAQLLGGVTE